MNDQLALLPDASPAVDQVDDTSWELDEHTRHVGRQGLAAARQALREACARKAACASAPCRGRASSPCSP